MNITAEEYKKYQQKWVALAGSDDHIVGVGDTLSEAKQAAARQGYDDPTFYLIPPPGLHIPTPFLSGTTPGFLKAIRATSRRTGLDKLSMREIDAEIRAARRERTPKKPSKQRST